MSEKKFYTKGEEIANAITHGIGGLLAIAALVLLVVFSALKGTVWHVVSFTIFGVGLVLLYTGSTLYHSLTNKKAKKVFRILDHAAIYFLIASSYTPFTLTVLRGVLGWVIFGIIWTSAIVGIVFKSLWVGKHDKLSTAMYILMGWMVVVSIRSLYFALPQLSFIFLVLGGLLYTLGALLYMFDKIPYNHAIWHLFVIAGSTAHFFSVMYIL
jgi:hemolysin III